MFDSYGNSEDKIQDNIQKDDLVLYIDSRSIFNNKHRINIKKELIGIWDGEKVYFDDEKTIVRTTKWLSLVKIYPLCKKLVK